MELNCKPKRKRKIVEGIFVLPHLKKDKHEKSVQVSDGDVSTEKEDEVPERMVEKYVG